MRLEWLRGKHAISGLTFWFYFRFSLSLARRDREGAESCFAVLMPSRRLRKLFDLIVMFSPTSSSEVSRSHANWQTNFNFQNSVKRLILLEACRGNEMF